MTDQLFPKGDPSLENYRPKERKQLPLVGVGIWPLVDDGIGPVETEYHSALGISAGEGIVTGATEGEVPRPIAEKDFLSRIRILAGLDDASTDLTRSANLVDGDWQEPRELTWDEWQRVAGGIDPTWRRAFDPDKYRSISFHEIEQNPHELIAKKILEKYRDDPRAILPISEQFSEQYPKKPKKRYDDADFEILPRPTDDSRTHWLPGMGMGDVPIVPTVAEVPGVTLDGNHRYVPYRDPTTGNVRFIKVPYFPDDVVDGADHPINPDDIPYHLKIIKNYT